MFVLNIKYADIWYIVRFMVLCYYSPVFIAHLFSWGLYFLPSTNKGSAQDQTSARKPSKIKDSRNDFKKSSANGNAVLLT